MPQSPSSSSSSEAERDAFEVWLRSSWSRARYIDEEGDSLYCEDWVQGAWVMWNHLRATPPILPIDFKQASEQGGWLPKTSAPDLCYSFDQESYTSGDLNEALQSLEDKGDLTEGVVFYMAEEQRHAPSYYFDIDDMLTSMGQRASEEAGEWPDDFPDVPKDKVAELQVLVSSWLDANVTATFFTAHNTREVRVTDEMIAAFKSEGQTVPSPHPEEGALLLGGDEGGKKGGA